MKFLSFLDLEDLGASERQIDAYANTENLSLYEENGLFSAEGYINRDEMTLDEMLHLLDLLDIYGEVDHLTAWVVSIESPNGDDQFCCACFDGLAAYSKAADIWGGMSEEGKTTHRVVLWHQSIPVEIDEDNAYEWIIENTIGRNEDAVFSADGKKTWFWLCDENDADEIFGSEISCLDIKSILQYGKEIADPNLIDLFREASDDEIAEYGVYEG